MGLAKYLLTAAPFVANILAQSACSGQQYNTLQGFPASKSGCYPTNYISASDLGNTSPSDAQARCSSQCTSNSQCGSYVAQVNKAADSNLYSGTCFFFSPTNPPNGPRQCADTAYLLIGFSKDFTNGCFSSSASAATPFCSSYLGIPVITSTSTPPVVTTTTTITTSTTSTITNTASATSTVSTTVTTTVTSTSTTLSSYKKREVVKVNAKRAVAAPACVSSNTPATRISAACSCLSVPTSTTTTTLVPVTTTSSVTTTTPVFTTVTTTVTSATVTSTSTVTVTTTTTVASSCPSVAPNLCGGKCVNYSNDRRNCGSCGNQCPGGFQCQSGSCSQPAPCSPPGDNIYWCNKANSCVCYQTTDGRGYCSDYTGSNIQCGSACSNSFDCPNGGACLTASSSGCGKGTCAIQSCLNPSKRRLLRSAPEGSKKVYVERRDDGIMRAPPSNATSPTY